MKNEHESASSGASNLAVVVGRQFGSGGRRIGKIIAQKLSCAYYDKELLAKAAAGLGFSQQIFQAHDEKKPSPFTALLQGIYGTPDNFHDTSLCGESIYRQQSDVIRRISEEGPCVIVGRTADYVLRDNPGLVSVFLHAPLSHRTGRILERGEAADEEKAREIARRNDRDRESYYNYFTGGHWGMASNYHLTIDASLLSDEDIADLVIAFAKAKTGMK